ncbi:MAG TPA: SDR family NAD(P)-dependent oxidoreductase [Solirubrobacteraceae bacterium]|nr:SDR family NAD(P)-dependent oxidoreductase [Solirubrobacteraceae bacterium]
MGSVLITGASRGIGRAAALGLAHDGWDVYAGVRRETDGADLGAEGGPRLVPIPLDVTDDQQIAALVDRLPERLDAVVNNAGIVVDGPLEAIAADRLRAQLETNVVGPLAVTQAVLPRIRASRGRIVFISSVSGRISAPMMGAYNASKFAIEGIADALRVELAPWGIREKRTMPVERVVETIERALTDEHPRARYPVGASTKAQLALFALSPTRAKDVMLGRASGIPRKLDG